MSLKMKRAGRQRFDETPVVTADEVFTEGDKTFKIKRAVTLPTWKFDENETKYFTILDKITESARLSDTETKRGKDELPPAKVAHVRDLIGGGSYTLIFGAGLYRDITENYTDDSYIGKSFKVTKLKSRKTKKGFNFNPYSVAEIEATDVS